MDEKTRIWLQNDPFYKHCEKGNLAKVRELANDLNINWKNNYSNNNTPLIIACINRHHDIIRYLLSFGSIDPNLANGSGMTAIMFACSYDDDTTVEMLVRSKYINLTKVMYLDETALWMACEKGNIRIVKMLIASGFSLNLKQTTNNELFNELHHNINALQVAKLKGHVQCVELIEEYIKQPIKTIKSMRRELGWGSIESEILSPIIIMCKKFVTDN